MNKDRIKLTESQLRQIIKESVDSILKESSKKKDPLNNGDARFIPLLKQDIGTLYSLYERWQYAKYKPEGIDAFIDAVINARLILEDIVSSLEDYGY